MGPPAEPASPLFAEKTSSLSPMTSVVNYIDSFLAAVIEIEMTFRVLKLRQVEEGANNIEMEQGLVLVSGLAKVFGLFQVDSH